MWGWVWEVLEGRVEYYQDISYFYSQRSNYKNVIKRIVCGDLNMQYKILLRFERAVLLVYWDKQRMEWLYSVFC